MKDFPTGVSYYTIGTADIQFPEDDICCYRCPLMDIEYKTNREYCRKTGEYLPSPKHTIGYSCPLNFKATEE